LKQQHILIGGIFLIGLISLWNIYTDREKINRVTINNEKFTPIGVNIVCEFAVDSTGYFALPSLPNLGSKTFHINRRSVKEKTFEIMKELRDKGINIVRLTGLSVKKHKEKDINTIGFYYKNFLKKDKKKKFYSFNGDYDVVTKPLNEFLNIIDSAGIKVILLVGGGGVDKYESRYLYRDYIKALDNILGNNKALFAYDFYNEPAFFSFKTDYKKSEIKKISKLWNAAVKSDKYTTYGLFADNDFFQWDPEILECDFVTFHIYPYLKKELNYDFDKALLKTKRNYRWYKENLKVPWFISETGFPGTNYNYKNKPFLGTEQQQLEFVKYSNNMINYSGGLGIIYWQYSEVHWYNFDKGPISRNNCYGIKYSFVNEVPESAKNKWKPAINELVKFSIDKNIEPNDITDNEYYNFFNYQEKAFEGVIKDEKGNFIKGATIIAEWQYYDSKGKKHKINNKTFSKEDGAFVMNMASKDYQNHLISLKITYLNKENYYATDLKKRFYDVVLKTVQ